MMSASLVFQFPVAVLLFFILCPNKRLQINSTLIYKYTRKNTENNMILNKKQRNIGKVMCRKNNMKI